MYYFGARYYDPRTSVWQSADPILAKYLPITVTKEEDVVKLITPTTDNPLAYYNLPGLGGVFESKNLNLYTFSHQNPIRYSDPDGKEAVERKVLSIIRDNIVKTRRVVENLNMSNRRDRAKLATIAAAAGYYDSFASAAAIIRSDVYQADLDKTKIIKDLRNAAAAEFLPKIETEIRGDAIGLNGQYTTGNTISLIGAISQAGSKISSGAAILGGTSTLITLKGLGDLGKEVNGLSPNAVDGLVQHGVNYYAANCGSGLDCGE